MNLQTLDLNLLKVFEALAEERSATKAGDRVGLTQSSVSNALNRLRQVFSDELFIRTPQGMQPTPRAEQLEGPIRFALAHLRDALASPTEFDLASATGEIRISSVDYLVASLATKLASAVTESARNVDLRFIPLDKATMFSDLDSDRVDLVISSFVDPPKRLLSRLFMHDRLKCLGRVGHPAFDGGLTIERYASYPHILISRKPDNRDMLDSIMTERGFRRRVGMTVGHIQSVPAMLAQTDYLATIPVLAEPALTALGTCETVPLPFDMPAWPIDMIWSRRADSDPLQAWARAQLLEIASAADARNTEVTGALDA